MKVRAQTIDQGEVDLGIALTGGSDVSIQTPDGEIYVVPLDKVLKILAEPGINRRALYMLGQDRDR